MARRFNDRVDVRNSDGVDTVSLDANEADVQVGGHLKPGKIRIIGRGGTERIRLDAAGTITIVDDTDTTLCELSGHAGQFIMRDGRGNEVLQFTSSRGSLVIGSTGNGGALSIRNEEGTTVFRVNGERAEQDIGGDGFAGTLRISDGSGRSAGELSGETATLSLGREGNGGDLKLLDDQGGMFFHVTGSFGRLRGALTLGGRDQKGDLQLTDQLGRTAIYADGGTARLQLGNLGNAGDFVILDNDAERVFQLDGLTAGAELGGNGKPGQVLLLDEDSNEVVRLAGSNASLYLGRSGNGGEILVLDNEGKTSFSVDGANATVVIGRGDNRVILDGQAGDIQLPGADCAEEFEINPDREITPGTVLIAASEDELQACSLPYDCRVAGVVSGARGVRPGIVLNKHDHPGHRKPIALNGKVYCKVDASEHPVALGDLLTTSSVPGYAMRACDRERAFGAVLGKALAPLESGRGLIPVLVGLL